MPIKGGAIAHLIVIVVVIPLVIIIGVIVCCYCCCKQCCRRESSGQVAPETKVFYIRRTIYVWDRYMSFASDRLRNMDQCLRHVLLFFDGYPVSLSKYRNTNRVISIANQGSHVFIINHIYLRTYVLWLGPTAWNSFSKQLSARIMHVKEIKMASFFGKSFFFRDVKMKITK